MHLMPTLVIINMNKQRLKDKSSISFSLFIDISILQYITDRQFTEPCKSKSVTLIWLGKAFRFVQYAHLEQPA